MHIIDEKRIMDGDVTDAYFERTEETLDHAGENPEVVAEVTVDQFEGDPHPFVGLDEVLEILEGLPVDVEAIPEGSWVDGGPVMNIEGNYRDFARYETAILGVLSQASGFALAAAEVKNWADDTPVLSFGSRHLHPMMAEFFERSAYIGGVDGYSNVAADLPIDPSGTMPHALMLSMGDREKAWVNFNEAVDDDIPRIALVDTFSDEVEEAIEAAETLGGDLDGVRLDTTGSRRGDFTHICREVRYKLDAIGRDDVDIYISGGLEPGKYAGIEEYVDGIGVGGYISDADTIDYSLDIVEVEGDETSKRGKLPGKKNNAGVTYYELKRGGETMKKTMKTMMQDGEIAREPDLERARDNCLGGVSYYV